MFSRQRRIHSTNSDTSQQPKPTVVLPPNAPKDWKANIISTEIVTLKEHKVLKVMLDTPLPADYRLDGYASNNVLCLRNNIHGGVWRITDIDDDKRTIVFCEFSKTGHLSEDNHDCFDWEIDQHDDHAIVIKKTIDESKPGYAFFLQPLTAHVRSTIHNIRSIDTVDQSFGASFTFDVRFRAISPLAERTSVEEFIKILSFEDKLAVLKVKEEDSIEQYASYFPGIVPNYYDYIIKVQLKGTFSEALELANFPVDTQQLTLTITCNRPNIIKFIENEEYPSIFMCKDFQLSSVFDVVFYEYVFCSSELSDPAESSSGYQYPRFNFSVTLARKAGYYFSNVCIPMCFISVLSLVSLSIDMDGSYLGTGDRLSVSLTLLLTGVAYKFVVASSLPQLSYQTMLDYYVWCCFAFLILLTIENTIYPLIFHHNRKYHPSIDMDNVESYVALALGLFFVTMNIVWISRVIYMVKVQSDKFDLEFEKEKNKRETAKTRRYN